MKRTIQTKAAAILASACCGLFTTQTTAETCEFTGLVNNNWSENGNWDCGNAPTSSDIVVIPNGKTCTLNGADGDALQIIIETGGRLDIPKGSTLTLHGTGSDQEDSSVINGKLRFVTGTGDDPELVIVQDHWIINTATPGVGDGIVGEVKGLIKGGSGDVLTIAHGVALSFLLSGHLEVQTELSLYATLLVESGKTVTLNTYGKSGGGQIVVAGGTLEVDEEISGDLSLKITSGTANLDAECTALSGLICVSGGTLNVNESLCTTGNICYRGGSICVADGATAIFSGTCP